MRTLIRRLPQSPITAFIALALATWGAVASAQTLTPEQQRFHDTYKELVEINTTHSVGDSTEAARAMEKRLLEDGFAAGEMQVFEPFPRKGNLVLRFKGNGSKKPLLLLAHLDVVEAKREDWATDPFKLQETGGYFTARGAIDDKAMASAFVSVLGQLRREGFMPSRDIVLALTADEERGNVPSNGVSWLLDNKPELLQAEFGINEGARGGELRGGKPFLNRIGVAEKISTNYELEVRDAGGHSSVPNQNNPVYALSAALDRLAAYRFPIKLSDVTKTYFVRSAPQAAGQLAEDMRAIGSGNPDAAVIERMSGNPGFNAQLRTTCVATMVSAGHAENALPQSARATVNCRILPQDDPQDIDRQLKQVINNDKIAVRYLNNTPRRSPASPLDSELFKAAEALSQSMWPGVPFIPAMGAAATDSSFLRNAGVPMYGVSGLFVEASDYRTHGRDERIEIQRLYDGREFLYRLVKQLAQ